MTVYILRKMLSHLAVLLFVNTVYISLRRIGKPSSHVDYDIKLVKQQTQEVLISAGAIGVSFGALGFLLVFMDQWNQNILVVIAAFFISVGMSRQIVSGGARRCNNKHECLLVVLGINSSLACKGWTDIRMALNRRSCRVDTIREEP